MEDLRLLAVHAHPDDESSKGAGTVARYSDEGVSAVLVCCTGGEAGDILNPAMDRPDVRENLAAIRRRELADAAAVLGYGEVVWLGYKDSGMPDTPENEDPACFARAPFEEAVGRLVAIIRRTRPHVIITYPDRQEGYPHPDHLRVHDISVAAFDDAGDPDRYPDAGPPWQPLKLYYSMWSRQRIVAMHEKLVELGIESPFDKRWLERPAQDDLVTTQVRIEGYYARRKAALLAHATQIDPASPFWFALPDEHAELIHPWDDYRLARSLVGPIPDVAAGEPREDDLFAGIRHLAYDPGT